jgi:hypothetical protein
VEKVRVAVEGDVAGERVTWRRESNCRVAVESGVVGAGASWKGGEYKVELEKGPTGEGGIAEEG